MANELKPCPFCGGEAEVITHMQCMAKAYCVVCKDKECRGRAVKPLRDRDKAIAAWNRRANDEQT